MTRSQQHQNTFATLQQHHQTHLLNSFDQLSVDQQRAFLSQIEALEWRYLDDWIARFVISDCPTTVPTNIHPAPFYPSKPIDHNQEVWYQKAQKEGETLIKSGKVAGFVVAGGQGTRLGFDGPKGAFPASPIKQKVLFQIFSESIAATNERYHTRCPFYIMTSPLNYEQTLDLFENNLFFGLHPDDIFIFQQGTLPNFSFDGKILLTDKDQIACSPDGHGGSLKALYQSGALTDMANRGIDILSYWQVDNPLINPIDPLFIGLHALDGSEMSSKALKKTGPFEKVGNFCLVDDKVTVIEYSDLPDDIAQKTHPDGSLQLELGSIGIHLINRCFIESLNSDGFSLPMHRAVKKIPFLNDQGVTVNPTEPNGVKLETFVFDALPLAQKSMIMETTRAEEFAPIKNAEGVDSAESSRSMMIERAATWLEAAGVNVPRTPDGMANCVLEIASSFALCPEDIKNKLDRIPPIKPGDVLYLE